MNVVLLAIALAAGVGSAIADNRTFTDNQGRTLVAELVSATDTHVTLKRVDGKQFVLSLAKLSDADQQFVNNWRDGKPQPAALLQATVEDPVVEKVEASYQIDKKKRGSRKLGEGEFEEKWNYEVEIMNKGRVALPKLTVKYEMVISYYAKYRKPRRGVSRRVKGQYLLKGLEPNAKAKFTTDTVTLEINKAKKLAGADKNINHSVEDLIGLVLTYYQGDKKVGTYVYGKSKP